MLSGNNAIYVCLGAGDEPDLVIIQRIQPLVVDIRLVNGDDAVRQYGKRILLYHPDVVFFAVGDHHEGRKRPEWS